MSREYLNLFENERLILKINRTEEMENNTTNTEFLTRF
jgi:hypothetical protein